jgi:dephospho-CoA kinase
MKIIGVVGKNGSGKDEVLKYLRDKYIIPFLSTGDTVREIAAGEGLELTRENLKIVSEKYFQKHGEGYFVKRVAGKIKSSGWKTAGISGIRSVQDVKILKDMLGSDFILIEVSVVDSRVRYARMSKRGEARDPQSFEQFMKQDVAEEALFHIDIAVGMADYSIKNDGTLDDMHREIDKLALKFIESAM